MFMTQTMLQSLEKLVPPPTTANPPTASWQAVESKLGLALPDEYKLIIARYGDWRWSDFLHLLNPFSPNQHLNLHQKGEIILAAERQSRQSFPDYYPLPLYPERGGLLPFCVTDNGDTAFWITQGQPNRWPILVKGPRAPECEIHFISVGSFLFRFSLGNFKSLIFPDFTVADDK